MLSNIPAYAAAKLTAYLYVVSAKPSPSPSPSAKPGGSIDWNKGHTSPVVDTYLNNARANVFKVGAVISLCLGVFLIIGTFGFNKKWGGRATAAIITGVILLGPAFFFNQVSTFFTNLGK